MLLQVQINVSNVY